MSKTSSCVSTAEAKVKAAASPFKLSLPPAFDASSIKGKTFAYIGITFAASSVAEWGTSFKQAITSAGGNAILFDGQGEPSVITQAFDSAISQKVSGIVTGGFDPTIVTASLEAAEKAHIPVIDGIDGFPNGPLQPGVVAHVTLDGQQEGTDMADWMAANSGCTANVAFFYITTSAITVAIGKAIAVEFKSLCPAKCAIQQLPIDIPTQATSTPTAVENVIQRSQVKYIAVTSDDEMPFILQGINAVGARGVQVVSAVGDTLGAAQKGNAESVDVLWPPNDYIGYALADDIMRAAVGKAINVTLPIRLVDKGNWGTGTSLADQYPALAGYQEAYGELWKNS